METMELQQTAENAIDLEARIVNWHGNVAGWLNELSRLGDAIENLSRDALYEKDPVQEEFLKCLQIKTNQCREHALNRADIMEMAAESSLPRYY
jgi:hypothetical protein